ncbi:MAG TPA: hypothetical protein VFG74_05860 [Miltoncostaeaceae bacterium]|nr:hypothetical protein [Miltoncostaeaceae bacterium]
MRIATPATPIAWGGLLAVLTMLDGARDRGFAATAAILGVAGVASTWR